MPYGLHRLARSLKISDSPPDPLSEHKPSRLLLQKLIPAGRLCIPSRYPAAPLPYYRVCRHCCEYSKPLFSVRSSHPVQWLPADSLPVLHTERHFVPLRFRKSQLPVPLHLHNSFPSAKQIPVQSAHSVPSVSIETSVSHPLAPTIHCLLFRYPWSQVPEHRHCSLHVPTADLCHPGTTHFHHRVSHIPAPAVPEAAEIPFPAVVVLSAADLFPLPFLPVSLFRFPPSLSLSLFQFPLSLLFQTRRLPFRTPLSLPTRLPVLLFCYLRSLLFPLRKLLFRTPLPLPTRLPALLFRYLRSLLFPLRRLPFRTPLPFPIRLPALLFRYLRSLLFPLRRLLLRTPLPFPTRLLALLFRYLRSLLFPLRRLLLRTPLPFPTRLSAPLFRMVRFPPALSPAIALLCSPLIPFCFLLQLTVPASSHFRFLYSSLILDLFLPSQYFLSTVHFLFHFPAPM